MCSRIQYKTGTGTHIVGRNMDWTEKMGTKLYVFPKG
ncbi:MAG TPA: linear amide C-N hydrolase, partial [Candidatus Binatia bacterium]|nr:linear amide C-N hydrolase [Candidatus Binatia bacterium]